MLAEEHAERDEVIMRPLTEEADSTAERASDVAGHYLADLDGGHGRQTGLSIVRRLGRRRLGGAVAVRISNNN